MCEIFITPDRNGLFYAYIGGRRGKENKSKYGRFTSLIKIKLETFMRNILTFNGKDDYRKV